MLSQQQSECIGQEDLGVKTSLCFSNASGGGGERICKGVRFVN
jgi:hypothetical protein